MSKWLVTSLTSAVFNHFQRNLVPVLNFPLVLAMRFASSSFMVDCCSRFIVRFLLPCLTDLTLEDRKQSFAFGGFIFRVENMPFISSASMLWDLADCVFSARGRCCSTSVFSQPEVGVAVRHSYRNSSPAPHPLCKLPQLLNIQHPTKHIMCRCPQTGCIPSSCFHLFTATFTTPMPSMWMICEVAGDVSSAAQ